MIQPGPCESTISGAHIMSCHVNPCYDLASRVQRLQFWDSLGRGQGPMSLGRVGMSSRSKNRIIDDHWIQMGAMDESRCSQNSEKIKHWLNGYICYMMLPHVLGNCRVARSDMYWSTLMVPLELSDVLAGRDDHSDFVAGLEPLIEHHRIIYWLLTHDIPWRWELSLIGGNHGNFHFYHLMA